MTRLDRISSADEARSSSSSSAGSSSSDSDERPSVDWDELLKGGRKRAGGGCGAGPTRRSLPDTYSISMVGGAGLLARPDGRGDAVDMFSRRPVMESAVSSGASRPTDPTDPDPDRDGFEGSTATQGRRVVTLTAK